MSEEPPTAEAQLEDVEILQATGDEGDKTQPTEDIWNALRHLSAQPFAGVPDPPSTQDVPVSDVKQEPTPPPPTEWDQYRKQVRVKPHDADAWLKLVDLAEDSGDLQKIQETYDALLEVYPNTVRVHFLYTFLVVIVV